MRPSVSLPQYEGPLDLLLELARRNEFDLLNLPIAEVTRALLDYMAAAEERNLDLDAEWFYLASALIHAKSRSLLPVTPEQDRPDPLGELTRQLLDRAQLAGAAAFLEKQWASGGMPAPPAPAALTEEEQPCEPSSLTPLEVLHLAEKALASAATSRDLAIVPAAVPVEDMLAQLERELAEAPAGGDLDFNDLLRRAPSNADRSALFLALLEAAHSGQVEVEQDTCFGPIRVRASQEDS